MLPVADDLYFVCSRTHVVQKNSKTDAAVCAVDESHQRCLVDVTT